MIKSKNSIAHALLFVILFLLSSCYYDELVESEPLAEDVVISFTEDIQPILKTNCSSCHPLLVPALDLTENNAYESMVNEAYVIPENAEGSTFYQRLLGNPTIMPPSGALPDSDIEIIRRWIEQGAPNN